ncbi:MAG: RNase P subunit p30 family protein, partial [Promethearchaeota archaeon]
VDYICIKSTDESTLNFTAKDSRIDIISLEDPDDFKAFSPGIASLAGQHNIFIELSFNKLLVSNGSSRSRTIRSFNKIINMSLENHARVIVSSFARNLVDVRGPWQKKITLFQLLGMNKEVAHDIAIKNPRGLIKP